MINKKFNNKFKKILLLGLLSLLILLLILDSNSRHIFKNSTLGYLRENLDNKLKDKFNNESSINKNNKIHTENKKKKNNLEPFECNSNSFNEQNVKSSNKLCNLKTSTNRRSDTMAQLKNNNIE